MSSEVAANAALRPSFDSQTAVAGLTPVGVCQRGFRSPLL
jgi:hypothetical protein